MKINILLLVLCGSLSFAQTDEELPRAAQHVLSPVTFEAIPYWSEDTSSFDLLIFYRIKPEFFFFSKASTPQKEFYEAKGELVFELFDDHDAAITREFRPFVIERNSLPEEGDILSDEIQGALTFKLKRGLYKIIIETKDSESGKSYINRDTKIDTRMFSAGLNISPAIFIESPNSESTSGAPAEFIPINRGSSSIIGQRGTCMIQVTSPDTSTEIHLSWNLNSTHETDNDFPQEFHGETFSQQFGTPDIRDIPKHPSILIKGNSKQSRILLIPIPLERLETGRFKAEIKVTQGKSVTVKNFSFHIFWPQEPRSLSDFKLAADALRHIATAGELDSMSAFSSSKSKNAFREFWNKRNPDTTRAFNPAMAEYYRRVDETIKRFSTSTENDGYKTDRGRIFILFGSPSIINRLLKPNTAPAEIWTYEKLNRRFIFTDQRKTGNFILTNMENY